MQLSQVGESAWVSSVTARKPSLALRASREAIGRSHQCKYTSARCN